jgi:fatty-acyl-CoA synthase
MAGMPPVAANLGVGSWIERRARIAPHRVALVGDERSLTYAELARRVRCLANGLRGLGVGRGDRVAWLGPNHPAFLEALFASGLVGAMLAPVNHRLEAGGIRAVLDDIEPRVLIQHSADPAALAGPVRHRIAVAGPVEGASDFEALVAASPDDPVEVAVGMDDVCLLPHTSGTTGPPKGIMLTHANVTWNVVNFLTCADFRGDDVTVAIAPFFRVGGTGVNVLPVLFRGGQVVVPGDLSPAGILRVMERHRVTVGFGNPDLLDALVRSERWPRADLSSVRFVVTGGAPVPERLLRAWLDRGVLLLQGYGLSEAAPLTLLLDPASATTKLGSAGRPPLLVDVRIMGTDQRPVGRGRPVSCRCAAPTSWPGTGGGPRPRGRSCRRTAGCGPAMPPAATRRSMSGSSTGWRTASSRSTTTISVHQIASPRLAPIPTPPSPSRSSPPTCRYQRGASASQATTISSPPRTAAQAHAHSPVRKDRPAAAAAAEPARTTSGAANSR